MAEQLTLEQEVALLKEAEEGLRRTQTAEDIRAIWRRYYLQLGHRKLGRLLLGRSAEQVAARAKSTASE